MLPPLPPTSHKSSLTPTYQYLQWNHESTGSLAANSNPRDSTFPQASTFHYALAGQPEPAKRFLGERFTTQDTGNSSLPAAHQVKRVDAQHRGEPTKGQFWTSGQYCTNPCGCTFLSILSCSWYTIIALFGFRSVDYHPLWHLIE